MNRLILYTVSVVFFIATASFFRIKFEAFTKAMSQVGRQKIIKEEKKSDRPAETIKGQPAIQNEATSPQDPVGQSLMPSELPVSSLEDSKIKMMTSDFTYDPSGRRDPFKPYLQFKKEEIKTVSSDKQPGDKVDKEQRTLFAPVQAESDSIEGYPLDDLKLVGIVWEVHDPKAMVKAPSNKVFLLHKQSRIGRNNGYVASIREGEIVVVEIASDGKTPSTRVISLQK
jgi:type IV pilus assembly protein PilP